MHLLCGLSINTMYSRVDMYKIKMHFVLKMFENTHYHLFSVDFINKMPKYYFHAW